VFAVVPLALDLLLVPPKLKPIESLPRNSHRHRIERPAIAHRMMVQQALDRPAIAPRDIHREAIIPRHQS
jgi:hypothetical protein